MTDTVIRVRDITIHVSYYQAEMYFLPLELTRVRLLEVDIIMIQLIFGF